MAADNTKRFSNRVEDYVKYRPGYPKEIISYLLSEHGLAHDAVIADIGSGTGISTEMFLREGHKVFAVEPNKDMREKATELLGQYFDYHEVNGTAEKTNLPDHFVDAIIAGQAFHWFQPEPARKEFSRILRSNGLVALIWNERRTGSDFEKAYDELIIRHSKDYVQVDHRNISPEKIKAFFSPSPVSSKVFYNEQVFDFEGLKGRLLSSSYMPSSTDEGYADMVKDLHELFDQYKIEDRITIKYDTKVFVGRL